MADNDEENNLQESEDQDEASKNDLDFYNKDEWIEREKSETESLEKDTNMFLHACCHGSIACIKALPRSSLLGIANNCNRNGQSGLSLACSTGNLEAVMEILAITSLDVNAADNEGNTPLMIAAQAGFESIIRFFVYYLNGIVNIDAENNLGFTALMKAALHGWRNCARILIIAVSALMSHCFDSFLKLPLSGKHRYRLTGADVTKRDWGRGLRADEWAIMCGCPLTALVIKNVSKCSVTERQMNELNWEKKHTNPVAEFCQRTGRRFKRFIGWGGNRWIEEAGSLYHLASSAASLNSGVAAVSISRPTAVTSPLGRSDDVQVRHTTKVDDLTNDDVLLIELKYMNNKIDPIKDIATQRYKENCSSPNRVKNTKAAGKPCNRIPEINYINASPTKNQRLKQPRRDRNFLLVPKRSFKKRQTPA